jgi:amidase
MGAAADALQRALARIDARDRDVRAWTHVARERAAEEARRSDVDAHLPLSGIILGVKDIIDVAGMPTTWGSEIYLANVAVRDAACVALARAAGAVIVGKTVSTEFAFAAPSRTRNPWNLAHSPGGSSSGSAAAVADGQVRIAFGTQTMGSVLRPASFCGVFGFKPTFGSLSLEGVRSLARSTDTLGWLAGNVADCALMWSALLDQPPVDLSGPLPHLGFVRTASWPQAAPAMQTLLEGVAAETGAKDVDMGFDDFNETIFSIAYYEMRQSLATERLQHLERLSPNLREILEATEYTRERYVAAVERVRRFDVDAAFGDCEILLTPAAPGEAPDPTHTGDPVFNRIASVLGLPAIAVPIALGPQGLPLGVQLMGKRHQDARVLAAAQALAARYPFTATLR